jgi:hypothetical protein
MAFAVATGRRVKQDGVIYTEGQIVPVEDEALLEDGTLIEVPDPPKAAESKAADKNPGKGKTPAETLPGGAA